ncbi:MAG: nicotinate-nucleotide adenylyltransferase [Lachnospiraceae bacterium]|jgi:nicotinate-nucleotide adenylyltransferase|nr:nicotinate-nucleotide adenylyltransferase [Lachnospiraceae bacterium]
MKKVGILGGTFNPVHMAHLIIAEIAREEAGLDDILFIPSGCSYLKDASDILPAKDRIHMTGLAIEDNSHFALSTIEIDRGGNSYTCDTLLELKHRYPDQEYYLIVGADNLFTMEEWKDPEVIFGNAKILAAVRGSKKRADMEEKIAELKEKYHADITLLHVSHVDISSSLIREKIAQGLSIRYMLPEKVREYIIKNHFYEKKDVQE